MSVVRRASAAVAVVAALFPIVGCASAPPPGPSQPIPSKVKPEQPREIPKGQIDRRMLDLVLMQGPPWLLERVPIEEVMEKGKFVGWRVRELPQEWSDAELRPGDVVTAVNGQVLETPNDFWAAWTTLSVASELKIAYQRDGEPQELSMPIHGRPDPRVAEKMSQAKQSGRPSKTIGGQPGATGDPSSAPSPKDLPPPPSKRGPKRKPTIVIGPPPPPKGDW